MQIACLRPLRGSTQPGLEPATCESQVRCPTNSATTSAIDDKAMNDSVDDIVNYRDLASIGLLMGLSHGLDTCWPTQVDLTACVEMVGLASVTHNNIISGYELRRSVCIRPTTIHIAGGQ